MVNAIASENWNEDNVFIVPFISTDTIECVQHILSEKKIIKLVSACSCTVTCACVCPCQCTCTCLRLN